MPADVIDGAWQLRPASTAKVHIFCEAEPKVKGFVGETTYNVALTCTTISAMSGLPHFACCDVLSTSHQDIAYANTMQLLVLPSLLAASITPYHSAISSTQILLPAAWLRSWLVAATACDSILLIVLLRQGFNPTTHMAKHVLCDPVESRTHQRFRQQSAAIIKFTLYAAFAGASDGSDIRQCQFCREFSKLEGSNLNLVTPLGSKFGQEMAYDNTQYPPNCVFSI
eukprot:1823448-Pleurochrysis_carterae.AAC.2